MPDAKIPNINRISLAGRTTKDPEIKITPSGLQILRNTIAIEENYKDQAGNWQKQAHFFDFVCFKLSAEAATKIPKGTPIFLEGKLKTNNYTDQAGNNRKSIEITAETVQPLIWLEKQQAPQQSHNPTDRQGDAPF
jgi:single-strand DNA-binding protein